MSQRNASGCLLSLRLRNALFRTVAVLLCTAVVVGQAVRDRAGPDPYTKGEPARLAKAGYVNLGPFEFGTDQTTGIIENLLGTEPLMWVETKHFRLGCALPPLVMKGREPWRKDWQKRIKVELAELRKVLPGIKKKPKVLDPWLRTHLYAQRLEKLYRDVLDVLAVEESWFGHGGSAAVAENYRGEGPFLGMKNKFTVLILRTKSSHARYTRAFLGYEMPEPIRFHDIQFGSMYWGCSTESANGLFHIDPALHAGLTFNIAHNLYTAFRGFTHDLPAWVTTGLGHWHARQVSPRFPTYDRKHAEDEDPRSPFWDWEMRVHGLVKNDVFEAGSAFVDRSDAGQFGVEQHIQSWAFVDYLLKNKKPQFATFINRLKDPFHERRKLPTPVELRVRQRDAVKEAFACKVDGLDTAWRSAVLSEKPKRRRRRSP